MITTPLRNRGSKILAPAMRYLTVARPRGVKQKALQSRLGWSRAAVENECHAAADWWRGFPCLHKDGKSPKYIVVVIENGDQTINLSILALRLVSEMEDPSRRSRDNSCRKFCTSILGSSRATAKPLSPLPSISLSAECFDLWFSA